MPPSTLTATNIGNVPFCFHGVVDLAAILPFYLTLGGVDLRALRILQLVRIVRILKLSRYSEAMARFAKPRCR